MKLIRICILAVLIPMLSGCAGYSGVVKTGENAYKVSCRSASGFVSINASKNAALSEAGKYCEMQGKTLKLLNVKSSKPPYILGNFPKTTVEFMCLDPDDSRVKENNIELNDRVKDDVENKMITLNKLLSDGLITKSDFEENKAKLLNEYTDK